MVQQLSLYGSIDDRSLDLFVSTLKTLSGNPPILFANIASNWQPDQALQIERVNSKNQLMDLNRIRISRDIPLENFKGLLDDEHALFDYTLVKRLSESSLPQEVLRLPYVIHPSRKVEKGFTDNHAWVLHISDIPAAGNNRKVVTQTIAESVILSTAGETASAFTTLSNLGYKFDYQYVSVGIKFYMKNEVMMDIVKIWHISGESQVQVTQGGYLVKAYVNVSKNTDIERLNVAEQELQSLQKELHGYIELEVSDRRSMDPRPTVINGIY